MASRGGARPPADHDADVSSRAQGSVGASGASEASARHRFVQTDRRHDSRRATRRRREAEDALLDAVLLPSEGRSETIGSESQVLLMKSLARLERQADVEGAIAWSLDRDGDPVVIAAVPTTAATRLPPERRSYGALAALDRVQRLTDSGLDPVLRALAAQGISAAAPVPGLGQSPSAVILLVGQPPGRPVRPRTVAILGEVASRLRKTLSTSLALERMAELDAAVQRVDRLAALGGLVSEIVHEIRNPLVSVKTFLQLLPDRLEDPEFHGEFRQTVSDEVARLERMLEELLRHARPMPVRAPVEPEARIADAVVTTLQLLGYRCRERGILLETELREDLPTLGLPEDGLRQLFMNLLLNASDVTPSGGRIRIRADWSQESANHVEILIEDEGPGIEPHVRPHVFEPFWTTREQNAGGLGLAICKRIVEEADGRIELVEPTGTGACFRVVLPIAT